MKSNNQGKFGWIQALILPIWMGIACKSELNQDLNPNPEASEVPLPTAEVATTSSSPLELTGRVPLLVRPGTTVTLSGNHIRPTLTLAFGGEPRLPVAVTVASDAVASFVTPSHLSHGPLELIATQEGVEQKISLFFDAGLTDYPIFTGDPSLISKGQNFYDANGILQQGTKASEIATALEPCAANRATGCAANALFPAVELATILPANIKSGVKIAGVTGAYPSAAYNLTGDTTTPDLNLATFNAKIKSASNFAWFDSAGDLQTYAGDVDIIENNIKSGVTIFGTTGSVITGPDCTSDGQTGCLTTSRYQSADTNSYSTWDIRFGKTIGGRAGSLAFYNNMANTALYNRTTGTGALAGLDIFDTIDDTANGLAFPTQNPWSEPIPPVPGANWIMDSVSDTGGGGGGVAADGICNGTEDCVLKDQTTNLYWARSGGVMANFEAAINYCDSLTYGSYSDWILPSQKVLTQASVNGIWSKKDAAALNLSWLAYWSSSTVSDIPANVWVIFLRNLTIGNAARNNNTVYALCVR